MRSFVTTLVIAAGALASAAAARPSAPLEMASGVAVEAPRGYVEMCARDAALCDRRLAAATATARPPQTERERLQLLKRINRRVNARIRPRVDPVERWERAIADGKGAGDCEDYAIEKYAQLTAAGFPADRLFYAIGYARGVGLHAVLVARTAQGDLVLDSRTPWADRWERTPYVWLSRQSTANPAVWTDLLASS